jgi:hypothetical protein
MKQTSIELCSVGALAACLSMFMMPTAVGAQTVTDEVRCVLLSNALASGSDNPRGRQVGASVGAYFLGRLDMRPPAEVKAAIATQKRRVTAKNAVTSMNACAARATQAENRLRTLAK